jgi:hypothetical protein
VGAIRQIGGSRRNFGKHPCSPFDPTRGQWLLSTHDSQWTANWPIPEADVQTV